METFNSRLEKYIWPKYHIETNFSNGIFAGYIIKTTIRFSRDNVFYLSDMKYTTNFSGITYERDIQKKSIEMATKAFEDAIEHYQVNGNEELLSLDIFQEEY